MDGPALDFDFDHGVMQVVIGTYTALRANQYDAAMAILGEFVRENAQDQLTTERLIGQLCGVGAGFMMLLDELDSELVVRQLQRLGLEAQR